MIFDKIIKNYQQKTSIATSYVLMLLAWIHFALVHEILTTFTNNYMILRA